MTKIPNFIVMLHSHLRKDLKQRVEIRVHYDGKSIRHKTELTVQAKYFNRTGQIVTNKGKKAVVAEDKWILPSYPKHHEYNLVIKSELDRLKEAYRKLKDNTSRVSAAAIIQKLTDVDNTYSILEYLNLVLAEKKLKSATAARHYKEYFEKLFWFLKRDITFNKDAFKFEGETIHLQELDHNTIKRFKLYLSNYVSKKNTNLSVSTISKHLSTIKFILENNPNFYDFISKQFKGMVFEREGDSKAKLSTQDFDNLFNEDFSDSPVIEKCVDIFLFCYYALGPRIGEVLQLKKKDYNNGRIKLFVEKSGDSPKFRDILLSSRAVTILGKYLKNVGDEQYIFPFLKVYETKTNLEELRNDIENSTTLINRYLKKGATRVGIEQKTTTHVARHSFITEAINRTGDIYLVSQGVGHETVKTTEDYAEIKVIRQDELNNIYENKD